MIQWKYTKGKGRNVFKSVSTHIVIAQEVNSGCPFSPPSVPAIPWPPSILVSLWFNFLLLYECSMVQGSLTPPNAGEAEVYNMAVPHEAHRTVRM